jgi:hypothetical protein
MTRAGHPFLIIKIPHTASNLRQNICWYLTSCYELEYFEIKKSYKYELI